MKTLKMMLEESGAMMKFDCMLNEAFSSNIMAELHKNNPETMNQFFRSLAKFRYSVQGLNDEFISKISVSDALTKNKSDKILKIWMKGPKVAFFSVANTVIDTEFNWNGRTSRGKRDNTKVFGDPDLVAKIMSGEKWSNIGLTDVYQIAISSLKALGEKKQPTEVATKDDKVVTYTMSSKFTGLYAELPTDFREKIVEIITRNSQIDVPEAKGQVWGKVNNKDGSIEFFLIKSSKPSYYKDRWGVKHRSVLNNVDAVHLDFNGNEGKNVAYWITSENTAIIAKSLTDFKKGKYWEVYADKLNSWQFTDAGSPSNTPTPDSSIKTAEEAKSMVLADVPVVLGYSSKQANEFYFLCNSSYLENSTITQKELQKNLDNEFGSGSWYVLGLNVEKNIQAQIFRCSFTIPFVISDMEPRLLKVFQQMNKNTEYHTFVNETGDARNARIAAEKDAAEAAEKAKLDAKNAKLTKEKDKIKEWNASTSAIRNKVKAQANSRRDKMIDIAQKAASECWDKAETYKDVIVIWRKYLKQMDAIVANEPLEIDGIPVNPTGMYYRYVTTAGETDYSKPMGIPCMPGYRASYYRSIINDFISDAFNKWVKNKGYKPGKIGSDYYFLFPSIVMIGKSINIYSSGLFLLVNRNFLVSTNNGKNISGTMKNSFVQFALADDFFRTNSSCYALK